MLEPHREGGHRDFSLNFHWTILLKFDALTIGEKLCLICRYF